MVQKKKDGINLRTILFVFFGFIIVASLAYKYFEWAVAKDVVNTYNRNWTKELKVLENDEVEASESAETITKLYEYIGSDKFTYEDVFDQFDKLNALLNVGINDSENHLEILKQNKNNLSLLKSQSVFLVGKNGETIKRVISGLSEYYDLGIKNVNASLVHTYALKEYFSTFKDNEIIQEYYSIVKDLSQDKASNYFYILAPLEKYSKDDYKLSKEDEIKSLFPQSYSGIMKSVIYSKSYYSFVRDQAMGDSESADYKWSKLNEDGINLSFDINTLLNEGSDKDMLLNKKIISILDENVSLTNSLYKSLLSKNIFGKIGGFIDNPVACTTYISKVGFYNDLTKKYPSAKTIDDLISELSEIAPTTENLDLLFKRSTMSYINNKDMIKFICIDHINKKEYKFVISK